MAADSSLKSMPIMGLSADDMRRFLTSREAIQNKAQGVVEPNRPVTNQLLQAPPAQEPTQLGAGITNAIGELIGNRVVEETFKKSQEEVDKLSREHTKAILDYIQNQIDLIPKPGDIPEVSLTPAERKKVEDFNIMAAIGALINPALGVGLFVAGQRFAQARLQEKAERIRMQNEVMQNYRDNVRQVVTSLGTAGINSLLESQRARLAILAAFRTEPVIKAIDEALKVNAMAAQEFTKVALGQLVSPMTYAMSLATGTMFTDDLKRFDPRSHPNLINTARLAAGFVEWQRTEEEVRNILDATIDDANIKQRVLDAYIAIKKGSPKTFDNLAYENVSAATRIEEEAIRAFRQGDLARAAQLKGIAISHYHQALWHKTNAQFVDMGMNPVEAMKAGAVIANNSVYDQRATELYNTAAEILSREKITREQMANQIKVARMEIQGRLDLASLQARLQSSLQYEAFQQDLAKMWQDHEFKKDILSQQEKSEEMKRNIKNRSDMIRAIGQGISGIVDSIAKYKMENPDQASSEAIQLISSLILEAQKKFTETNTENYTNLELSNILNQLTNIRSTIMLELPQAASHISELARMITTFGLPERVQIPGGSFVPVPQIPEFGQLPGLPNHKPPPPLPINIEKLIEGLPKKPKKR